MGALQIVLPKLWERRAALTVSAARFSRVILEQSADRIDPLDPGAYFNMRLQYMKSDNTDDEPAAEHDTSEANNNDRSSSSSSSSHLNSSERLLQARELVRTRSDDSRPS